MAAVMMGTSADKSDPLLGRRGTSSRSLHADDVVVEEVLKSTKTVYQTGFRREVWLFLHQEKSDRGFRKFARQYEIFSVGLVVYLVTSDIVLSIPEMVELKHSRPIAGIELFIYALFTTEYLLRMWSCMADQDNYDMGPIKARLKLASSTMNLVDFLVCSAYFINFLPGFGQLQGMGALRMIRLLRVAALAKVERKTNSFGMITQVFTTKKMELLSTVFMALVLMVMSAAVMYYIETDTQPVVFGSIPMSLWWSVTALTTVGYGDVSPMTSGGQLVACIIAFFGVGIFALPAGILGEGFMEAMAEMNPESLVNPVLVKLEDDKRKKAVKVEKDIKSLKTKVQRVQKSQQQIIKLLEVLGPEMVAQEEIETMGFSSDALQLEAASASATTSKKYAETGLASHYAALGEKDLASVQNRVERKLGELTAHVQAKVDAARRH